LVRFQRGALLQHQRLTGDREFAIFQGYCRRATSSIPCPIRDYGRGLRGGALITSDPNTILEWEEVDSSRMARFESYWEYRIERSNTTKNLFDVLRLTKLVYSDSDLMTPVKSQIDLYRNFYLRGGVPYWQRWNSCPIEQASKAVRQLPVPQKPMHSSTTALHAGWRSRKSICRRSGSIARIPIVAYRFSRTSKYLSMRPRSHCMDSSFYHLAESIQSEQ
jgi:hypothetical protein